MRNRSRLAENAPLYTNRGGHEDTTPEAADEESSPRDEANSESQDERADSRHGPPLIFGAPPEQHCRPSGTRQAEALGRFAWKHSRHKTGRPCVGLNGTVVWLPHWEQIAEV